MYLLAVKYVMCLNELCLFTSGIAVRGTGVRASPIEWGKCKKRRTGERVRVKYERTPPTTAVVWSTVCL